MENLSPRWQKLLMNVGWYVATLVVLAVFMRVLPFVLVIFLGVGIIWGAVLAYEFAQLLFGAKSVGVSEAQLQAYLSQTETYKAQIEEAIESLGEAKRVHLLTLAPRIKRWTEAIEKLVQRLDNLQRNEVIRRDFKSVPKAIADLEQRLATETDDAIRLQLERTLDNRRKQFAALQDLQNVMKRAEIQIESTLSMLGTIYSQILTGQSTNDVADYRRLSSDVDEEVRQLNDHLQALREVKLR